MIDSHAHLNFKAFRHDYQKVIKTCLDQKMKAVINVGSNYETSRRAIEIAKKSKLCYVAIGLHAIHVKDEEFDKQKYISLYQENKNVVKAIGETGFDFYHNIEDKDLQKQLFLSHIDIARNLDLPVILHCRDSKENPKHAYQELLIAINNLKSIPKGVIHCFSSDWKIAQQFLDLGFYIGFDGPITFKNASPEVLQVVKKIPLDKTLIETDCPFLAPEPHRGERNEPAYVRFIGQKIAEIKDISFKKVVKTTTKNAVELFNL